LFTAPVAAFAAASLLSDIGHEMATAVFPILIGTLGLGAATLGLIEGAADLLNGLARMWGGWLCQRLPRKKGAAAFGYFLTAAATGACALARGAWGLLALRSLAWAGRGYRAPLRDFLISDAVPASHYGRAFGLERAGDMAGAVMGPLAAAGLVALGLGCRRVFAAAILPGFAAGTCIWLFVRERPGGGPAPSSIRRLRAGLPRGFPPLLLAILVFGMGDFSRSFLILAAARAAGARARGAWGLGLPILLYVLHNAVSAASTFPAGRAADRWNRLRVLAAGYGLGALCNLILCLHGGSIGALAAAFVVSGAYIAVEETVEKACVSQLLRRSVRGYGLGLLAAANAAGDMASSAYVGLLWEWAGAAWAFGTAAAFSAAGCAMVAFLSVRLGDGPAPRGAVT
jgi:MFS family permease